MKAFTLLQASAPMLLLATASCSISPGGERGVLQPQSTSGACVVEKFFLVRLSSTHTSLTVDANAPPCQFTLINPDLGIVNDSALVIARPAHGAATATLIEQGRSINVSYAPAPGYMGADQFEIIIQPLARAVTFAVNVRPANG